MQNLNFSNTATFDGLSPITQEVINNYFDGISVVVGDTFTLPAGEEASVEQTETDDTLTLNFNIPRGAIGETGPRGVPGFSSLTIGEVETNFENICEVTNTGTYSDAVLNFNFPLVAGPTGGTGPAGINGTGSIQVLPETITLPAGSNAVVENMSTDPTSAILKFSLPRGDLGPAPSLSIGTVTTVNSNVSASASITGSSENPVLNLSIPKGQSIVGPQGPSGPKGSKGSTGAKGDKGDDGANASDGLGIAALAAVTATAAALAASIAIVQAQLAVLQGQLAVVDIALGELNTKTMFQSVFGDKTRFTNELCVYDGLSDGVILSATDTSEFRNDLKVNSDLICDGVSKLNVILANQVATNGDIHFFTDEIRDAAIEVFTNSFNPLESDDIGDLAIKAGNIHLNGDKVITRGNLNFSSFNSDVRVAGIEASENLIPNPFEYDDWGVLKLRGQQIYIGNESFPPTYTHFNGFTNFTNPITFNMW